MKSFNIYRITQTSFFFISKFCIILEHSDNLIRFVCRGRVELVIINYYCLRWGTVKEFFLFVKANRFFLSLYKVPIFEEKQRFRKAKCFRFTYKFGSVAPRSWEVCTIKWKIAGKALCLQIGEQKWGESGILNYIGFGLHVSVLRAMWMRIR